MSTAQQEAIAESIQSDASFKMQNQTNKQTKKQTNKQTKLIALAINMSTAQQKVLAYPCNQTLLQHMDTKKQTNKYDYLQDLHILGLYLGIVLCSIEKNKTMIKTFCWEMICIQRVGCYLGIVEGPLLKAIGTQRFHMNGSKEHNCNLVRFQGRPTSVVYQSRSFFSLAELFFHYPLPPSLSPLGCVKKPKLSQTTFLFWVYDI